MTRYASLPYYYEKIQWSALDKVKIKGEIISDSSRFSQTRGLLKVPGFDSHIYANNYIYTPLGLEIISGNYKKVESLLKSGANPNEVSTKYDKYTPLMIAAECGHTDIAKLLVKAGATINQPHKNALIIAAKRGHTDIIKILVEAGGVVNQPKENALEVAAKNEKAEAFDFLFAHEEKGNRIPQDLKLALYVDAICLQQVEILQILVQKAVDLDINMIVDGNDVHSPFDMMNYKGLMQDKILKVLLQSKHYNLKIMTVEQKSEVIKVLKENPLLVPSKAPLYNDLPDGDIDSVIGANKRNIDHANKIIADATNMLDSAILSLILEYTEGDIKFDTQGQNLASAGDCDQTHLAGANDSAAAGG